MSDRSHEFLWGNQVFRIEGCVRKNPSTFCIWHTYIANVIEIPILIDPGTDPCHEVSVVQLSGRHALRRVVHSYGQPADLIGILTFLTPILDEVAARLERIVVKQINSRCTIMAIGV